MAEKENKIAEEFAKNAIPVTWGGMLNTISKDWAAGEDYRGMSSDEALAIAAENGTNTGELCTKLFCAGYDNQDGRAECNCLQRLSAAAKKFDDGTDIDWKALKNACRDACHSVGCDCILYMDKAAARGDKPWRVVHELWDKEYKQQEKPAEKITDRQLTYITALEKAGAPKFNGDKKAASVYIDKYLYLITGITDAQWKYITNIRKYNQSAPEFTGKTKKEASDYIDKYGKQEYNGPTS